MAVAHLRLDQGLLKHVMVGCMVDWRRVDGLAGTAFERDYACGAPLEESAQGDDSDAALPVFVHYCQSHALADYAFAKRAVPAKTLAAPVDATLPSDLFRDAAAYLDRDGAKRLKCGGRCGPDRALEARRAAFVICAMESALAGARLRAQGPRATCDARP